MRARRSIEMRTSGGCSETDMNAFAVIPCTCSPTRVVRTVTPVANIPSVRRKARDGSSVEVADVDLLRDRHVVERRVAEPCERAGRESRQDERRTPRGGGASVLMLRFCRPEEPRTSATPPAEARRSMSRAPSPPPARHAFGHRRRLLPPVRPLAVLDDAAVEEEQRSRSASTETPMIFSFVPP